MFLLLNSMLSECFRMLNTVANILIYLFFQLANNKHLCLHHCSTVVILFDQKHPKGNHMLYSIIKTSEKKSTPQPRITENMHTVDSNVSLRVCLSFVLFYLKGIPGIRGNPGLPGPPGVEVQDNFT